MLVISEIIPIYHQLQKDIHQLSETEHPFLSRSEFKELIHSFQNHGTQFFISQASPNLDDILKPIYAQNGYQYSAAYHYNRSNFWRFGIDDHGKIILMSESDWATLTTAFSQEEKLFELFCGTLKFKDCKKKSEDFRIEITKIRTDHALKFIPHLHPRERSTGPAALQKVLAEVENTFSELKVQIHQNRTVQNPHVYRALSRTLLHPISFEVSEPVYSDNPRAFDFQSALTVFQYEYVFDYFFFKPEFTFNINKIFINPLDWSRASLRDRKLLLYHELCVGSGLETSGNYDQTLRFSDF